MSSDDQATDYTQRLRALIDNRMAAVEPLVARATAVAAARDALEHATHAYADTWADAIAAGWSEDELRKVFKGLAIDPAPRRRKQRTARPAATPSAAEDGAVLEQPAA
ncbi:hypothetical protein [Cellulomonas hominis]|uniref:hypothetical protein n=1 Tax=Cellulomonas hominis TaxID=156981 RepID=UPI001BCA9842|nr:hypothetical protein [Cellulomonas hominis]